MNLLEGDGGRYADRAEIDDGIYNTIIIGIKRIQI